MLRTQILWRCLGGAVAGLALTACGGGSGNGAGKGSSASSEAPVSSAPLSSSVASVSSLALASSQPASSLPVVISSSSSHNNEPGSTSSLASSASSQEGQSSSVQLVPISSAPAASSDATVSSQESLSSSVPSSASEASSTSSMAVSSHESSAQESSAQVSSDTQASSDTQTSSKEASSLPSSIQSSVAQSSASLVSSSAVSNVSSESSSSSSTQVSSAAPSSLSSAASSSSIVPDVILQVQLPLVESFAADTEHFFSADYRASENQPSLNFYYRVSGNISLLNGSITLRGARFTLGNNDPAVDTYAEQPRTYGDFTSDRPYRLSFCVLDAQTLGERNSLAVYVSNSTTAAAASKYGAASRLFSEPVTNLTLGQRVVIDSSTPLEQDFFQIRTESGAQVTLSDLWIGNQDNRGSEPSNQACAAKLPPASSSSSSAVSSVALSSSSIISSSSVSSSSISSTSPSSSSQASSAAPVPQVTLTGSAGDGQVSLQWSGVPEINAQEVYVDTDADPAGRTKLGGLATGVRSYTATGLSNNTPYWFWIKFRTLDGVWHNSNTFAATPKAADNTGISNNSTTINSQLRFKRVRLHILGSSNCVAVANNALSATSCGAANQELRINVLNSEYLSLVDNASGRCIAVSNNNLTLADCSNAPNQQFAYTGSAASGYRLASFSANRFITANLSLATSGVNFEVLTIGDADRLAVIAGERPTGWATMAQTLPVPVASGQKYASLPTGSEATRSAGPTTGGGSWEAARAKNFSNVYWFKPSDFIGATRAAKITELKNALGGTEARIVLLEQGDYDLSLANPKIENSCTKACSNGGGSYTEVGGFCNTSSPNYTVGGYRDYTDRINFGSNKTLLGLGSGAKFRRVMFNAGNSNLILRNLSLSDLPGDVRQWNDGIIFYPGNHVWLDHLSFAGFGRGAVVLSGTRRDLTNGSFYTYRDAGWMTFSWLHIDSSENWRCGGREDSPYPFFTTENPGLTFDHVVFYKGHGRNPAIDGEGAHFINSAWIDVSDGLNGRANAQLRVEGSYLDGNNPVRWSDPTIVYAPWDASLLSDKRKQNIFGPVGWPEIQRHWGNRLNTLNTNSVPVPPYPYSLDAEPRNVLDTVNKGSGVGKAGFPHCTVNATNKASYQCQ